MVSSFDFLKCPNLQPTWDKFVESNTVFFSLQGTPYNLFLSLFALSLKLFVSRSRRMWNIHESRFVKPQTIETSA